LKLINFKTFAETEGRFLKLLKRTAKNTRYLLLKFDVVLLKWSSLESIKEKRAGNRGKMTHSENRKQVLRDLRPA